MKEKNEEDELLERIAKEMMKRGDVKSAFDVEEKLRKSFGKMIKSILEAEMVSNITDKIIPEMEEWKSRRLEEVYPFVYIDAIHFNVKTNGWY